MKSVSQKEQDEKGFGRRLVEIEVDRLGILAAKSKYAQISEHKMRRQSNLF